MPKKKPPMHPRSSDVLEGGNVNLSKRPVVKNKDGSISTVRSMSFSDRPGEEILVPTVERKGKGILSDRAAIRQYRKTGEHLGKFKTVQAAEKYAKKMHQTQDRTYSKRKR